MLSLTRHGHGTLAYLDRNFGYRDDRLHVLLSARHDAEEADGMECAQRSWVASRHATKRKRGDRH